MLAFHSGSTGHILFPGLNNVCHLMIMMFDHQVTPLIIKRVFQNKKKLKDFVLD